MAIALGIDTGGTYTDAALVEYDTTRVLASAKALTTKHDLAIGIRQAVDRVLTSHPAEVGLVSLSTTLATNAIVEGNGAPIAALLIGYRGRLDGHINLAQELGTARYALIPGGHDTEGEEWEPLDLDAARAAILEHAPHVAAFAISGYFGTRNPSHELAVKRLVAELTGLPVTCGHELTHKLDALRRATTVALNARLIPLLCHLIEAVERTLADKGIVAPLMVVKGDGSLMEASVAKERPIETILSGPAASVVGAQHLAGGEDVVVVDMGGTPTDIAVIRNGRPSLSPKGAEVGRWRTMVEAIDVHTVGLGGDSRVWFDEGRDLRIGPRRVAPISLLAVEFPQIVDVLRRQPLSGKADLAWEFLMLQNGKDAHDGEHPSFEPELMEALSAGPCPLDQVYRIVQHPELYWRYLDRLERQGVLMRAGFTPSDAAHVLGYYSDWDRDAARLAVDLFASRAGQPSEDVCRQVVAQTAQQIAAEVVAKLLADDGIESQADVLARSLIARALRPAEGASIACSLTLRPTLVAIGAPVRTYFPAVADLLHGSLGIPDHTEVANAVGAVAGSVVQRVHILIVPQQEGEVFRVHLPDAVQDFSNLADALVCAREYGERAACEGARRAGAQEIRVQIAQHDHTAPLALGWGDDVYLSTTLEVTAVGRPRLA